MYEVKLLDNIVYDEKLGDKGLLDLYIPQVPGQTELPLLIYFHGGGLEGCSKRDDHNMYMALAAKGVVIAASNYRMYPDVKFPVFIEDAANAVSFLCKHIQEYAACGSIFIGGVSAGSYLTMMLHFAKDYLAAYGIDNNIFAGYIFDAGQPTTHYNILRERGLDTTAVRVDEAAPIYYLTHPYEANTRQRFLVICAENDIPGRKEQNELLIRTMETHGYNKEQIDYHVIPGFTHGGYVGTFDEQGHSPYANMIWEFINS